MKIGQVTAICWLATFALSALVLGTWVSQAAEGVSLPYLGYAAPASTLLLLLVSIGATIVWARQLGSDPESDAADAAPEKLARRRFLAGGATIAGGLVGTGLAAGTRMVGWGTVTGPSIGGPGVPKTDPHPRDEWGGARVKSYRRLGRTGVEISDISLGSSRIDGTRDGEAIARRAIERGVNYFDTAPDYSHAGSETTLGRAMQGHRDEVFLATKFCRPNGHLGVGASVQEYMDVVDGSLKRLQTDHVDLVHIHACDRVDRLLDPNAHEAFDRLKEQGKVRFLGVSTHTPNLEAVADAAIASGRFDVMMLAYHFGAFPRLPDIIDRAAAADIGVVAMKTLKGARHRGMESFKGEANSYAQAAFKWVLSNPNVSGLVISFSEHQHVDEYLFASGQSVTAEDVAILERYDELIAGSHCLQHCGACLDSCPAGVPIDDVLRYRMYYEDYGAERDAMELYSRLETKADQCAGCSAPCTNACPFGIPVPERVSETHGMLTLRG